MNKKQITLYCKKEGWAVVFENKFVFSKRYEKELVAKYVGEQYKTLRVETMYYFAYETTGEKYIKKENRKIYTYDYIIRDFNGNPVTVSDLPYSYNRKKRQAKINIKDGDPIPGTGKKNKNKYNRLDKKNGKGFLKQCNNKEKETEKGIKIPPIRKKVVKKLFERKVWDYDDGPFKVIKNKSWKKYRKNQWK